MSEYIVTGATGYIGYVLVLKLVEEGLKPVKILIRNEKAAKRFEHLGINAVIGNINDEEFLEKEITKDSVVFHLAGVIAIKTKKEKHVYDTNVGGTIKIVEACIKNNAKKLIYVSSVSAIMAPKKNGIIVEPSYFDPKKVVGHYAKTKAMATEYVLKASREGKLNAVVVYPSAVIGPYDFNISSLGQVVVDYMNNKLPAITKGKYNFVDVRDVASGIIGAYKYGRSGEDYLLTGQSLNLVEMLTILNQILGRKKLPVVLPLWFLKCVAPFVELHYLIRKKTPVFSRTSLKILNQSSNFDNSKAIKELGFSPMSTYDSFNDMITWLKENKKELLK